MRWISIVLVSLVACGDDDGGGVDAAMDVGPALDAAMDATADSATPQPDGGADDAGFDAGLPSECPAGDAIAEALEGTPGFVVVGSDFSSTSVAILDPTGDVLAEGWIDSGTTAPGLVASLGGDVVAPAPIAGTVGLLDRFGADVATRICFDGTLIGQLRLGPAEGFRANAHDWVAVAPTRAWATRYERNPDALAPAEEAGNDLYGFDPRAMTPNGERIDLSDFDAMVTGIDMEGAAADVEVSARPDRIVRVDGHVVVGLDRLPVNLFGDVRGHGEGTVAIVADDGTVTSHTLSGLANCGRVQPVVGTTDEVLVTCTGYSDLGFGEPTGERATAGHVRLRIADGAATEVSAWRAADDETSAMAVYGAVSLGGDRLVAVAPGDFSSVGDRLFVVDLASGAQTLLVEAGGSFVLGDGAYDGAGLLLVPDANDGSVRRFTVSAAEVVEGAAVPVGPASLPPRSVRVLLP